MKFNTQKSRTVLGALLAFIALSASSTFARADEESDSTGAGQMKLSQMGSGSAACTAGAKNPKLADHGEGGSGATSEIAQ